MEYNYHFHSDTGEFLGISERKLDEYATGVLKRDVYVIPAQTTLMAPPEPSVGFVACFVNKEWILVEDHRGKILYRKIILGNRADEKIIRELGEEKDSEFTLLKPPDPNDEYSWDGIGWVRDEEKVKIKTNNVIMSKLYLLDIKSIRGLREMLAKTADAPQQLKDYEIEAANERSKIIK